MFRLLDLCCGAGGCSVGYNSAGFEVVGVDTAPQPHYPFEFHQADALTFDLSGFDAVHASPPCQAYSALRARHPLRLSSYPRLIPPLRQRFRDAGLPYIIENVEGAPLASPIMLCGSMFGLRIDRGQLRRHRLFECSFPVYPLLCEHLPDVPFIDVSGTGGPAGRSNKPFASEIPELMGIDWATRREASQMIPPAYTEYIGRFLHTYLRERIALEEKLHG